MKHLLLIIFSLISLNSFSQEVNESNKSYDFYCYMQATGWLGSDLTATICTGDMKYIICDNDNKPIGFKNYIQVINLMSKVGWEYVGCERIANELDFILKKKVTKEEEATAGLNFQPADKGKKKKK